MKPERDSDSALVRLDFGEGSNQGIPEFLNR